MELVGNMFLFSFSISRKDQSFMSMLRNFKLEDLISKSGIAIQKGLHHMKTNVSESDLFSLQEEVIPTLIFLRAVSL